MTKLCIDCKWQLDYYCNRKRKPKISPVNGQTICSGQFLNCSNERSGNFVTSILNDTCGESGRFWEPKE